MRRLRRAGYGLLQVHGRLRTSEHDYTREGGGSNTLGKTVCKSLRVHPTGLRGDRKVFESHPSDYRERGVVLGGAWPNQWIALRTPRSTQKQRVVELPPEHVPTPQVWVDDEAAISEAIR